MKTTLLLAALLLMQARAGAQSEITVDIWRPPDLNQYGNPDPGGNPTVFVGSYTVPGSPYSPEFNFHGDTLDWRPFGLSYFKADIHGTFTVATPGTGRLMFRGGAGGIDSAAWFSIDEGPIVASGDIMVDSIDHRTEIGVTLTPGVHSFDMIYQPSQVETLVSDGDLQILPDGKDGAAIIDEDHPWGPTSSVPESSWLCWLLPLGLLLWRRK